MAFLWVFALDSVRELIFGVIDFELLELFCPATAVEDGSFNDLADVLVLVVDSDLWAVVGGEAQVEVPDGDVWGVAVVVLADYRPWAVAGWDQHSVDETHLLLKSQVYIALVVELLV